MIVMENLLSIKGILVVLFWLIWTVWSIKFAYQAIRYEMRNLYESKFNCKSVIALTNITLNGYGLVFTIIGKWGRLMSEEEKISVGEFLMALKSLTEKLEDKNDILEKLELDVAYLMDRDREYDEKIRDVEDDLYNLRDRVEKLEEDEEG